MGEELSGSQQGERQIVICPPLQATKDKFVRLNADFDNFRKRTAAEKEALTTKVKGDTVMALVPLIDNFELAKGQIKLQTEGEQNIDAAYQGLYKQMVELFRRYAPAAPAECSQHLACHFVAPFPHT